MSKISTFLALLGAAALGERPRANVGGYDFSLANYYEKSRARANNTGDKQMPKGAIKARNKARRMQNKSRQKQTQIMSDPIKVTYYNLPNGLQVFDLIEDWGLGFHGGNVLKYVLRAGVKDPEKHNEDLDKAIEYVKRMAEKGIKAKVLESTRRISPLLLDEKYHYVILCLFTSDYRSLIRQIQKLKL